VDQFAHMLAQKLRQPLELKPDWSANLLDGSPPRVQQRLELSMVAVPRCLTCSLILIDESIHVVMGWRHWLLEKMCWSFFWVQCA
jgi:hypothetical protein